MSTNKPNIWNQARLSIDWRADRNQEYYSIDFERPRVENPEPRYPVVAGKPLSTSRLPSSGSWARLFATVIVKTFDEQSLTIQYGEREIVLTPEQGCVRLETAGMDYTTFELSIEVKYVPEEALALVVSHDERFLRRFRIRERVMRLSEEDSKLLKEKAAEGDAFAQYGLGRWLYYRMPSETSMIEAEELFLSSMDDVPDALAAYAVMWRCGETKENRMDLEKSDKLLQTAIMRGSALAELQKTRTRIFGLFCEAEPETVAQEIELRMSETSNNDPQWHTLLAFAYEQMGRTEDAAHQYELAIEQGDIDKYFFLAVLYQQRGNMALYDSIMEEGIEKGCAACYVHTTETVDKDDFQNMSQYNQRITRERIEGYLEVGIKKGDSYCAYTLCLLYYNGWLGFGGYGIGKWAGYLKKGMLWADVLCTVWMAQLAEDGDWPEKLSDYDIGELWLKAARYSPHNEDALRGLHRVSDPAFLLHHKDELEKYWYPLYHDLEKEEEQDEEEPDDRYDAWA